MSVYGIAGYSGSGKTTVTQKLKQLRETSGKKSIILPGDIFQGRAFAQYAGDEARRIYNDPSVVHPDGVLKGRVLYEKPDDYMRLREIAWPHAHDELQREIEKYDSQDYDVFVDWIYVPVQTGLYDETIFVDTDTDIRHERLFNRPKHSCSKERAIKRDFVLHPVYRDFKPNHKVENNGDEVDTSHQIEELATNL